MVAIAVQVDSFGIHHRHAKVVENASGDELAAFLNENVYENAVIKTKKWTGYKPSEKNFQLVQGNANKGKTHPKLHQKIMMFKAWTRGIHHRCKHQQQYLNEFCYRFNRLKNTKGFSITSSNK